MIQEEGRAGRRNGANSSSDSYTICLSLESLLILWNRIYQNNSDKVAYRQSLLFDVEFMLATLVVPTHCLKSVLAHKSANPFLHERGAPTYLPHPCLDSCSFCCGEYKKLFPPLVRNGVCLVLMDLFSGDNRISGDITFIPVLLDRIKKYPNANRIVFGVKSNKEPEPVMIKKMLLMLIASNILRHTFAIVSDDKASDSNARIIIKAVLSNCRCSATGMLHYALFDDYYWHQIRVCPPVHV